MHVESCQFRLRDESLRGRDIPSSLARLCLILWAGTCGLIGCGEQEPELRPGDRPEPIEQLAPARPPEAAGEKGAAEAHYDRGRTYLRQGRYDEAIGQLSLAVELKPDFARALDQLGLAHTLQLNPLRAIPLYERAIALEPGNGLFRMHLGKTYMDLGDRANAREAYKRALELGTRRAKIYYDLGVICEKENDLEAARSHFQQAIDTRPEFSDPYCRLGIVVEKLGDAEKAADLYLRTLELDPDHVTANFRLAQHYLRQGRTEEGQRLIAVFERLKQAERESQ